MKIFESSMENNYRHIIYEIFGIKLKIKNPLCDLYQKVYGINKILDYLVDIENLPKAKGELRTIQKETCHILSLVDKIAKQNNLAYWLDFGTLIGAARHKGYIPWDDDIDVCMVRNDYEKILPLLRKEIEGTDYYIRERAVSCNNFQLRIMKDEPNGIRIGLDIFPVDEFPAETFDENLKRDINNKIQLSRKTFDKKWGKKLFSQKDIQTAKEDIKKIQEKFGLTNSKIKLSSPILFYSIDYPHAHKYKVFDYANIFPLKTLEFEDMNLPVPNKYEKHLESLFGNWRTLPKSYGNIPYFWE